MLRDAFYYLTYPVNVDQLSLATVMEHPVLSRMWSAHCSRELSSENLAFWAATRAFQQWVVKSTLVVVSMFE